MPVGTGKRKREGDAIDLLEEEDLELNRLFATFDATEGSGVEVRATHGDTGKRIVRHVAIREAARTNVAMALDEIVGSRRQAAAEPPPTAAEPPPTAAEPVDPLESTAAGLRAHTEERRRLLDHLEEMTRGVQGIDLDTGQDFGGAVQPLHQLLRDEMRWDLEEAIPVLRRTLTAADRRQHVPSARFVRTHAPTHLRLRGQKWYERNRFLTRLRTVYDHLRDYPSARSEGEA